MFMVNNCYSIVCVCVCVYKIWIKSENGQTTDNDRPAGLQAGRNLLDWKEAGAGGMQSDK